MRFSHRYGYRPVKDAVQFESMDNDLRNTLWNALYEYLIEPSRFSPSMPIALSLDIRDVTYANLWSNFFKLTLDNFDPRYSGNLLERLKALFFKGPWFDVYDVIEFIVIADPIAWRAEKFRSLVNSHLEREVSAYRFVGEHIAPITDKLELGEIEIALSGDSRAVSFQLEQALQYLSDPQSPDYRNSIKKSISAVESEVRSTLGREKGTLGQLLPELETRLSVHPALREAFSKLYGYTSDAGGIRHALMDDSRTATFEEAKFMLVACSAFINYVRGTTKA